MRSGVCLVPEHRGIFKLLTVEENLLLGLRKRSPWLISEHLRIFGSMNEEKWRRPAFWRGTTMQRWPCAYERSKLLKCWTRASRGLAPVSERKIIGATQDHQAAGVAILLVDK
jgi:branched-chain amino acid transport system ATP-binding protein